MGPHIWAVINSDQCFCLEKCLLELPRNCTTRCYIFGKDTRFLSSPDHSTRLWGP